MRLLKRSHYKKMPWKNGLGVTEEIAIDPPTAQLQNADFLWRLSCAKITAPNSFSNFKNYDRLLAVWEGAGLELNQKKLAPLEILQFRGEEEILCVPLSDEVFDLGLIFRRQEIKAQMNLITCAAGDSKKLVGSQDHLIIFCTRGRLNLDQMQLDRGDALILEKPEEIMIESHEPSAYFQISIERLEKRNL